jgi:integrase
MPKVGEIRPIERSDGRKNKYGISYPRPGKPPKRVFQWSSKSARDEQLAEDRREAARDGTAGLTASAADVRLLADLREMLPENVDPREAVRFFVEYHRQRVELVPLSDAVRGFLHGLQVRELSWEYIGHCRRELDRLLAALGPDVALPDISGSDMVRFFAALPLAPRTKSNYRDHYDRFFRWCMRQGWLERSPMEGMDAIRVAETDPNVVPVADVRAFFAECMKSNPKAAPFMALSFFAGLRSSQIPRLKRGDLNFEERGITMPGATHKTRRRFYVEGHEENLWAWLEPLRKKRSWKPFADSTFRDWREKIYLRAGVEYPHNGARDSFCSYHIALHNDASRTATLLTHRGVNMLYGHYRGKATRRDAVEYFKTVP